MLVLDTENKYVLSVCMKSCFNVNTKQTVFNKLKYFDCTKFQIGQSSV